MDVFGMIFDSIVYQDLVCRTENAGRTIFENGIYGVVGEKCDPTLCVDQIVPISKHPMSSLA